MIFSGSKYYFTIHVSVAVKCAYVIHALSAAMKIDIIQRGSGSIEFVIHNDVVAGSIPAGRFVLSINLL